MTFAQLHQQAQALLICNVWDASSALVAQRLNFQAIGTSSAAIAASMGHEDGEQMDFEDLLAVVKSISRVSDLPLTVDIESGYSAQTSEIIEHIHQLSALGVVGINIEDSQVTDQRRLVSAQTFAEQLNVIKQGMLEKQLEVFINVRTDGFLLTPDDALLESKKRIKLYQNAGADGIFVPGVVNQQDIHELVACTSLPINVMCMPALDGFEALSELGVKRISMGNFVFDQMLAHLQSRLEEIQSQQAFSTLFVLNNSVKPQQNGTDINQCAILWGLTDH